MTTHSTPFFVALQDRGLIHIEGEDRHAFLQGLVSNDVLSIPSGQIRYACLLTPQGKFLHDLFIHEGDGFLLIDCEGGNRARDLYDRLNKYRLRSKVKISVEESSPVYAVFGTAEGHPDPRHKDMGHRTFTKPDHTEKPFEAWDTHRIRLGIPDGSRDMIVERDTLLDGNIDKLNGIDWDKGCYMGQELTARMHYRTLGKKRLHPVKITGPAPAPFTDIHLNGELIGQMRSFCGNIGLAMLRDDALETLHDDKNPIRLLG